MTYQGSTLRNRPEQFDLLKITRECGMVLQLASGASYLQCDPTNFVRNLSDRLSIKSERNIVDLYLEELEKSVLSDSNKFANALQPTVLENDDESNQQDSPMRLWLKVELLQVSCSQLNV